MIRNLAHKLRGALLSYGLSNKVLWLFIHPFIIVLIAGFFLVPFLLEYAKEVIAFGCLTTLFVGVYMLAPKKIKFIILSFSSILLSFLAFLKLSFYQLYGVKLSASALFVIFETNTNETSEFIANYLNAFILIMILVLLIPLIWVLIFNRLKIKKLMEEKAIKRTRLKILFPVGLILLCGFIIQWKFKNENILLNGYNSYQEYTKTKEILTSQLANSENNLVAEATSPNEEAVYVVVIGESTSTWHMQLYGYPRETNPKLSEIKNEMIVFEDVISPNVHTILALEKILTFANFENKSPSKNASIVQMANAAGFETYWISNQQPVGIHESLSTIIGNAAKNKHFIATEGYKYTIHDEALLPVLDSVLQEKKKKKLIFLHLIGTHVGYYKRYPSEFRFFESSVKPEKGEKANEYINTYDNAVRYNDSIVRAIIDKVKSLNTKSYVAYFSDHGDDVYDVEDIAGHNEYLGTKPMYEVPFIVWFSEKYNNSSKLFSKKDTIKNRVYNLEDFIYGFAEISEIAFPKMDSSRSVFSDQFVKRARLIKEGEDYDQE